jgi:S-adenosylmethionine/arginine decarboxylase-like enzyme
MMEKVLGVEELQAGWRIGSVPEDRELIEIAERLIRFVGMTADPPPDIRAYPNTKGRGGLGIQGYFPLTESWLIISTWPAHGFTRINLSSCKDFDPVAVGNFLGREFKANILESWQARL